MILNLNPKAVENLICRHLNFQVADQEWIHSQFLNFNLEIEALAWRTTFCSSLDSPIHSLKAGQILPADWEFKCVKIYPNLGIKSKSLTKIMEISDSARFIQVYLLIFAVKVQDLLRRCVYFEEENLWINFDTSLCNYWIFYQFRLDLELKNKIRILTILNLQILAATRKYYKAFNHQNFHFY
jgi:hypothetical protein